MLILSVLFSAVIIIIVFSVLILVHEWGHFISSKKLGVRVERFALGFGKKLFGIKKGETEYVVNLFPLGGYVKLAGDDPYEREGKKDEFYSKPALSRFLILLSGPLANYVFAFLILVFLYSIGTPMLTNQVGSVLKKSPAESAGMRMGDRILAIDERNVKYWDEIVKIIRADKEGLPLELTINRGKETFDITVTPSVLSAENIFKQKVSFVGIGIAPGENVEILKSNPAKSMILAGQHVWFFTAATYKGIWLLVTGAMPVKENVGGPIRIVETLAKAIKYGPISVLNIMATISLALAIFNLLPFPILDGGHMLFLIIEKIRRKPLNAKTQEIITNIALMLLIAFVLYVSYFDTVRVITGLKR